MNLKFDKLIFFNEARKWEFTKYQAIKNLRIDLFTEIQKNILSIFQSNRYKRYHKIGFSYN